ncbi:hypothetical protein P280DRAFT_546465 [Massarina eburnea CBS 473.64]|uniref:Zn(2)-C6 fungal-type domain-containing protein n=1 Tax=Massarina eburnea CBS 473.64 TaxID=1395130 RepID=A0A6A6SBB1_9PLEO|nr:hypothetical protein P280DRAFT_546465 [Massarina eburnea CBS 473.64]
MSSAGVEKRGSATTVKACDSCRKRKRRCLWTAGASSCNHCMQLKEQCTTTHVRRQRAKPQKKDRVVEYERRIQNLESLLQERSAAQPRVQEQPLEPADMSVPLSTWVDNLRSEVDAFPDSAPNVDPESYEYQLESPDQEPLSAQTTNSNLPKDSGEDTTFQVLGGFEPSADFQVEAALLQDPYFQLAPADSLPPDPTSTNCNAYLPPPELGTSLLKEFLVDINTVFPLYRPHNIAEHLRICYIGLTDGSALAWASTYVVLGLAHRSRSLSAVATPEDDQLADWYLCKILPTVSGLLVSPPSFGLVQCLLAMGLLIRSSRHITPYNIYILTALRIAQCIAYGSEDGFIMGCNPDIEQQRRVFWLAFILDTDENIFSNIPMTHQRGDITAAIPSEDLQDSLGTVTAAEGTLRVNFFDLRVRLALLQSEAIEQFLSIKARKRTPQETLATAQILLKNLEKWRNNELFSRTPEELFQLLYRSDLIHTLGVEGSYFATVFRLQAFLVMGMDPLVNPFSAENLKRLAAQKKHECYKDAKHFLGLLSTTPHEGIGSCLVLKRPLVAALVTVLAHHIHSPQEAPSPVKMREYSEILCSMGSMVQDGQDIEFQRARDLAISLFTRIQMGPSKGESSRQMLQTLTSVDPR